MTNLQTDNADYFVNKLTDSFETRVTIKEDIVCDPWTDVLATKILLPKSLMIEYPSVSIVTCILDGLCNVHIRDRQRVVPHVFFNNLSTRGGLHGIMSMPSRRCITVDNEPCMYVMYRCLVKKLDNYQATFTWFVCDIYMYFRVQDLNTHGQHQFRINRYCENVLRRYNRCVSQLQQYQSGLSAPNTTAATSSTDVALYKKVKYTWDQNIPMEDAVSTNPINNNATAKTSGRTENDQFDPSRIFGSMRAPASFCDVSGDAYNEDDDGYDDEDEKAEFKRVLDRLTTSERHQPPTTNVSFTYLLTPSVLIARKYNIQQVSKLDSLYSVKF